VLAFKFVTLLNLLHAAVMKQIKKMFQKDYIYDPVMHQYHELLRNFYFLSLHLVV